MSFRARQALAAVGLEESLLRIGTVMKSRLIHNPKGGLAAQSYDIHGRVITAWSKAFSSTLTVYYSDF